MPELSTDLPAVHEVLLALERAGVQAEARSKPLGLVVDGIEVQLDLRPLGVVTPAEVRRLGAPKADEAGVVVADRITESAREELASKGWGWLDRRGHLRLWTPGLRLSTEFETFSTSAAQSRFASLFPPVGIEVALALLKSPTHEWSVTELAAGLGRAAGGVSERLRALRDAGLVDRRNRPLVPELFWEVLGAWRQPVHGLAEFPPIDDQGGRALTGLSWLGVPNDWVLTAVQAAVVLGAPVVSSGDGPPDFYVPQPSIVDLAVAHFAPARGTPAATVRSIRFTGIHEEEPFRRTPSGFPIAHPVVVALDLAQDRSRGRESVEAWDPSPLGVTRVW